MLAILERDGGVIGVFEKGAGRCGLERIEASEIRRGDIAVLAVMVAGGEGEIGSIALGDGRFAAMSERGVRTLRFRDPNAVVKAAWRVP